MTTIFSELESGLLLRQDWRALSLAALVVVVAFFLVTTYHAMTGASPAKLFFPAGVGTIALFFYLYAFYKAT